MAQQCHHIHNAHGLARCDQLTANGDYCGRHRDEAGYPEYPLEKREEIFRALTAAAALQEAGIKSAEATQFYSSVHIELSVTDAQKLANDLANLRRFNRERDK